MAFTRNNATRSRKMTSRKLPADAEIWYNRGRSGAAQAKISRARQKRCKAIVQRNLRNFKVDDTDAEYTRTLACLSSYFNLGFLRASLEIGERPFPFSYGCWANSWLMRHNRYELLIVWSKEAEVMNEEQVRCIVEYVKNNPGISLFDLDAHFNGLILGLDGNGEMTEEKFEQLLVGQGKPLSKMNDGYVVNS